MKKRFFELAKAASIHSDHPSHKLGAVVVKKSIPVSIGFNRIKTSPRSPHGFHSVHAEMSAIFKSRTDLDDCILYVYRETKDGVPAESRPCSACMEVIRASGIKKIYYSTNGGYKGEVV